MADFLGNILTFPTLFYTGLLGLTILYWLSSMIGLADFDFDGGDVVSPEVGDALEVDGSDASGVSGWLSKFKLDGIPVTISVSLVIFLSWIICFLVVHYYDNKISDGWVEAFVGLWVIVLAPVVSAPIAGTLLSPLKPVFQKLKEHAEGRKADSLVGHIAIVRTNKVNMNFGDADIESEGASLILKVRAEEPNTLKRGDRVLITDYISGQNIYKVRPASQN